MRSMAISAMQAAYQTDPGAAGVSYLADMWGRAGLALLSCCVLALAGCSEREPGSAPVDRPASPPAIEREAALPQLRVEVSAPEEAHQGFEFALQVSVRRFEDGAPALLEVSFGDGERVTRQMDESGFATVRHTYTSAGTFRFNVRGSMEGAIADEDGAEVTVHPRRVLYIQGMNSVSKCPGGSGFSTRAPEWLAGHLGEPGSGPAIELEEGAVAYFSYSGEWCGGGDPAGGAFADYDDSDTCGGIDEVHAPRLKRLIESLGPGRVTIVGHSMGGLVAAYLVASDPAWAAEHIASVATFDSPLRGVNGTRLVIAGAGGVFDGDCGPRSDAVEDLKDDSAVVKVAAGAAMVVPFYTSDATDAEKLTLGRVEAVPAGQTRLAGEAAHTSFSERHSRTWTIAGDEVQRKRRFVACAIAMAFPYCLDG
jgi:pimeloyl-ACP methyl ester carboxylesterase